MTTRSLLLTCICVLTLAGCASQQAAAPSPSATLPSVSSPTVVAQEASASNVTATSIAPSATAISDTPTPAPAPTVEPSPTALPAPTEVVANSPPVRLVIDSINLDQNLVSVGLDKARVPIVPKHNIGWYNLSAMPGQGENVVMWGHVLRFKETPKIPAPFARLKETKIGTRITVVTDDGKLHPYIIQQEVLVKPDQVEYMLPQGSERLTLISCIGDKVIVSGSVEMTRRLITIAVPEL